MTVERCNSTDHLLGYTFDRTLQSDDDGNSPVILTSGATAIPPGCQTVQSRINLVPPGTPPGRYHLDSVTHVRGNWRTFDIPWSSQPFQVLG